MTKRELIDQAMGLMREQKCSEESIRCRRAVRRAVLARKTRLELEFEIEWRQDRLARKTRLERQREAVRHLNRCEDGPGSTITS